MAGSGDYIDDYLDAHIIKTGFVNMNIFDDILERSDIVFNLRYPSMGETSGTLIQALSRGKTCFVTDDAWSSELPDNCVIKMDKTATENDICEKLEYLRKNPEHLNNIAENGWHYITGRPGLDEDCRKIHDFMNNNQYFLPSRQV